MANLKVQYDKKWSTIEVELGKTVQPGEATLQLDFVGNLNDKMHGFYRSCYKTADGTEKYLAATQFEVCQFTFDINTTNSIMFCFLEYICSTLFSVLGRTAVQGNIRCHA